MRGGKPAVLEQTETAKTRLVQRLIEKVSEDPATLNLMVDFFLNHLKLFQDEFTFDSISEYTEYLKVNNMQSFNGEPVKSKGELMIANFLFRNSVNYAYEAKYPHPTGSGTRRKYQPDFTVTAPTEDGEQNVYIEFWGVNREYRTAKFINVERYLNDMNWKCQVHKKMTPS